MSELPQGWINATIEEIAEYVQRGKSPKYVEKSELPVINQKCIRWSGVDTRYLKFIHPDQWDSWASERFLCEGDILWNSTGTGTIGRAALYKQLEEYQRVVADSHVTIVRANKACNTSFLHYFLRSSLVQSKIEDMQSGSTNQVELSRGQVLNTVIPLAPLNEQKRIADKLDRLLEKVDACRERCDRIPLILKRFRQSVLAAATLGELTEDWRERHKLLSDWKPVTFGNIGEVTGGLSKTPKRSILVMRKPYLRVANVYANRLELDDVAEIGLSKAEYEKTKLIIGDLLIVEGNGSIDQIGRAAIWNGKIADCVHQNHIIRWRADGRTLPKFALFWLLSPLGRSALVDVASSTSGLHTLSISKISALSLMLPTLDEQQEIVRRVEKLFAFADRLESRYQTARAKCDQLTPALLEKAFQGELVPQDPNDEPASVLLERIKSLRTNVEAKQTKPQRRKTAPSR